MILLSSSIHRRWVLHPLIQDEYQDWRLLIWQSNSPQLQSFFGSKSMENNILWLFCCFRVNGEDIATSSWRLNAANTRKWRWLEFSVIKLLRAKNPISRGESNGSAPSCFLPPIFSSCYIFQLCGQNDARRHWVDAGSPLTFSCSKMRRWPEYHLCFWVPHNL